MAYDEIVRSDADGEYIAASEYEGQVMIACAVLGANIAVFVSPEHARQIAAMIGRVADKADKGSADGD
jgi:hypothetical protein